MLPGELLGNTIKADVEQKEKTSKSSKCIKAKFPPGYEAYLLMVCSDKHEDIRFFKPLGTLTHAAHNTKVFAAALLLKATQN